MSDLNELYQQVIIEHSRHPRNFLALPDANQQEGYNPLCGDRVTVFIQEKNGLIDSISFQGSGCAISMASASLMTEALKAKPIAEVESLFQAFHELVTEKKMHESLGKLAVLGGVGEFPMRVKCATLCWHTMKSLLKQIGVRSV